MHIGVKRRVGAEGEESATRAHRSRMRLDVGVLHLTAIRHVAHEHGDGAARVAASHHRGFMGLARLKSCGNFKRDVVVRGAGARH